MEETDETRKKKERHGTYIRNLVEMNLIRGADFCTIALADLVTTEETTGIALTPSAKSVSGAPLMVKCHS